VGKISVPSAPDDLDQAHRTQAWLAVSVDPEALVSGKYFYHKRLRAENPATHDIQKQNQLLNKCQELSGIAIKAFHRD